jgi:CDP-diacylglycerol--glycerol-3-phosphate 3-phosphatidyltransferase
MKKSVNEPPKTFTDRLRIFFRGVLEGLGGFLNRLGIPPNVITISGLLGNVVAGVLIGFGHLFWGGLVAMLVGPLDALDGTMARLRGGDSQYGAFIDSVVDRYSEIALFAGLLVHFNDVGSWQDALLVFFAAVGSIMVSYVRARAESLDYSAKIGLLTRAERYIVLIPGIILNYPRISLWILAILTNFTALQRFLYVRKQAKAQSHDLNKKEVNHD